MLHAIEMQISLKNKEWFCVCECVWRVCVCIWCVFICVCVFPVCACSGAAEGEEGRKLDKFLGGEETLENSHTHALTAAYMTRCRPADFQTPSFYIFLKNFLLIIGRCVFASISDTDFGIFFWIAGFARLFEVRMLGWFSGALQVRKNLTSAIQPTDAPLSD